MVQRHEFIVERIVHMVEDRIEQWREEDALRKREADANRDALWAEAAERERLLKETVYRKSGDGFSGRVTDRIRVIHVVASEEFADAPEGFSPERERLIRVMPAPGGEDGAHLRASWLVFEEVG